MALSAFAILTLSACTLSRPGPLTGEFADRAEDGAIAIRPIADAPEVPVNETAAITPAMLPTYGFDREALAVGDVLDITIIESSSGATAPMLLPAPLQLTGQEIGESGTLSVPFAGSVPVAGRSVDEVRRTIEGRLRGRIYAPQVVVARRDRRDAIVTVQGQVAAGGATPVRAGLSRLGDVVGAARPQLRNLRNGEIVIQRGGDVARLPLDRLYADPAQNIVLRPGDIVTVDEVQRYVSVVGAAGLQGRIEATGPDFSVLDALAEARGLAGNYADPAGVYLLRRNDAASPPLDIYQVDMRDPLAIAIASRVQVSEGDVIVIATASFAQTRQLLSLAAQGLGVTANISRTIN